MSLPASSAVDSSRPLPEALPSWPRAWYAVARSVDLQAGAVVSGELAGRQWVLFRTAGGVLGALDAHCPHMGAHLGRGEVVGERLRCALHHWHLDCRGTCRGPGSSGVEARTWPVEERFGLVFLFAGDGEPPPLPAPAEPASYAWTTGRPVELETDWRAMMVNGFDLLHLGAVHHREIVEEPLLLRSDDTLRLEYVSRVRRGGGLADRVMKWASKDRIRVRQTCHGPSVVVESDLGRARTAAVLSLLPGEGRVRAFGAFGTLSGGPFGRVLGRVHLLLARWLFTAFLRKDFAVVEGMRLEVDGVEDPGVQAVAAYLRSLPEAGDAADG